MKYVNYDSGTGKILGWYDSIVNKGKIPNSAIEVDDSTWQDAINNSYNCYDAASAKFSTVDFSTDEEIALKLAKDAQSDMVEELSWADVQLNYVLDGDSRATLTELSLRAYRCECRDYVQYVDGVLTVVGDKPTRPE